MFKVKSLAMVALLTCSCGSEAKEYRHKFMADNDLWMEDNKDYASNFMTEDLFNRIISVGERIYQPVARQWGETLYINRMWNDSTVNASAWRDGRGRTEVRMYGGMARRAEVMPMSFALVLCHELGHLYGGNPYIQPGIRMAAEGQADYFGSGYCLQKMVENLYDNSTIPASTYLTRTCKGSGYCLKKMDGAMGLGKLLSKLSGEQEPNFETPDRSVVNTTTLSYPEHIQCRLDTYHNGILGYQRPRCWYAGG